VLFLQHSPLPPDPPTPPRHDDVLASPSCCSHLRRPTSCPGSGCSTQADNPTNPTTMTELQQARAITLRFVSTSSFNVRWGEPGNINNWGNRMFFAGASNLIGGACTPVTSPRVPRCLHTPPRHLNLRACISRTSRAHLVHISLTSRSHLLTLRSHLAHTLLTPAHTSRTPRSPQCVHLRRARPPSSPPDRPHRHRRPRHRRPRRPRRRRSRHYFLAAVCS
jgi:hypothetical protein